MKRDEETGLEYHKARYYISWLGRWMNCDPIGIGDGVNVYAYCRNNPVGNVDTGGTQTLTVPKNPEQIKNYSGPETVVIGKKEGFFNKSFFKGLLVGVVAAVAVIAVVATAGAALAVIAPAVSVAVGTAAAAAAPTIAAVGVVASGYSAIQSLRQRDLLNNKISKEQAKYDLGANIGGILSLGLAKPLSKGISKIFSKYVSPNLEIPIVENPAIQEAETTIVQEEKAVAASITTETIPPYSRKTLEATELEKLISTEPDAQSEHYIEKMKEAIMGGDEGQMQNLMAEPIHITTVGEESYILGGHNRIKAFSELGKSLEVTELSSEKAWELYPNKMEDITNGGF